MAINIFLYFPETDEETLRVDGNNLIPDFFRISSCLNEDCTIFYDNENIELYISKLKTLELYLASEINQLRVKLNKLSAISIDDNSHKKNDCYYLIWNFDEFSVKYAQNIIAEISERIFQYPQESNLLLNIQNAISTCREKILVFKDAKHLSDTPKEFAHIDFVSDSLGLKLWLNTKDRKIFSLQKQSRFKRTKSVQQGKPVFEEHSTGHFWYLDNFHKNEYEVFNSQREHIGVADMLGNIDFTKKVNGRIL